MSKRVPKKFYNHIAFKAGIPMVAFMLGGSLVLSEFMQTHMELKDKKVSSKSQRKFDLEEERKSMLGKLDLERDYTLSRIPRPDEEGTKSQKSQKSLQSMSRSKKNVNS
jgi:hypothetical protein